MQYHADASFAQPSCIQRINSDRPDFRSGGLFGYISIRTQPYVKNAKAHVPDSMKYIGPQNRPMEYDDKLLRQVIEWAVVESKKKIKVVFICETEVDMLPARRFPPPSISLSIDRAQKPSGNEKCQSFCRRNGKPYSR